MQYTVLQFVNKNIPNIDIYLIDEAVVGNTSDVIII